METKKQFLVQTRLKMCVKLSRVDPPRRYCEEPDDNFWVHVESLDDERHLPVFTGQGFEKIEDARHYFNGLCWGLRLLREDDVVILDETIPAQDAEDEVCCDDCGCSFNECECD